MAGTSNVGAESSVALEILEGPQAASATVSTRLGWAASCVAGGAGGVFLAGSCSLAEAGAGAAGGPGELGAFRARCRGPPRLRDLKTRSPTGAGTHPAGCALTSTTG